MSLTIKDRALLVKLFYKIDDCMPAALKKFRSLKGIEKGCGPISAKGLKNMIHKFEDTGSFQGKPGRGRKSTASTSVMVESVATALEEGMSSGVHTFSARGIPRCLDMPASTVHKIKRNIPALLSIQN